jgi:signal transduction histidine kinase
MRISIKYKFLAIFIIVFIVSILFFIPYEIRAVEKNNESIITRELTNVFMSSREEFKQYLSNNNLKPAVNTFNELSIPIADDIKSKMRCNTELYTTNGRFLYSSMVENEETLVADSNSKGDGNTNDINLAKKNKQIVSIIKGKNKVTARFTSPLYVKNIYIGIMRISRDYTYIYDAGSSLIKMLEIFTVILLIIICICSFFMAGRITNPILKLRLALRLIASGNYETDISINSRDEIGELSEEFCNMRDKIKKQIKVIEDDKQRILIAETHRKEFYNNVTHELKTPLTIISGYAQILLEEELSNDEMYVNAVNRIKLESERLHNMVVELVEISKKNSLDTEKLFEKVNLSLLIEEIGRDMSIKAEKYNKAISLHIPSELYINGIVDETRELLINILDNAIKYGKHNSTVEISVFRCPDENYITIEVVNEGTPIPKEMLERLFQPFYRAGNEYRVVCEYKTGEEIDKEASSGLGLYICRNIVDRHNGKIQIVNETNGKEKYIKVIVKIPTFSNNLETSK